MTEKEKMLNGCYYNYMDPELVREREVVAELVFQFNMTAPSQMAKRESLIRQMLGSVGEGVAVEVPFHCDYGCNLYIGKNFFANKNFMVLDCAKVTIGDDVLIGPNVGIYTPNHALCSDERVNNMERSRPVTIGDRVWIGGHTVILGNVTIGDDTVIGAGSVVTKDIPDGVVAFGNPCRVIREINENDKIAYRR